MAPKHARRRAPSHSSVALHLDLQRLTTILAVDRIRFVPVQAADSLSAQLIAQSHTHVMKGFCFFGLKVPDPLAVFFGCRPVRLNPIYLTNRSRAVT
jgi:hypothetical protein